MSLAFNPHNVDLDAASQRDITCYLASRDEDSGGGSLGVRISAVFVILVASTATTMFPVLATRVRRIRMPLYLYLFFRFFGSGVIIATAFIHLLDPAYEEIGPASCVGLTGGWASFTWPPTIAMAAALTIFLFEFLAGWYLEVRTKSRGGDDAEACALPCRLTCDPEAACEPLRNQREPSLLDDDGPAAQQPDQKAASNLERVKTDSSSDENSVDGLRVAQRPFQEQIAAFLILEFGIIFHSVIIGLNLGVVGDEFVTLYPVMVFHQSFEGLGIGARLSAIAFPQRLSYLPWLLALLYGLTTPVSIAAGMGLKTSYDSGSYTANVVSGVIDSASAGILMYTGLVEMLARDFLFDKQIIYHKKRVVFMLFCLFLGVALMTMLGKWA